MKKITKAVLPVAQMGARFFSGDQGEPERIDADRRQAVNSICGGRSSAAASSVFTITAVAAFAPMRLAFIYGS